MAIDMRALTSPVVVDGYGPTAYIDRLIVARQSDAAVVRNSLRLSANLRKKRGRKGDAAPRIIRARGRGRKKTRADNVPRGFYVSGFVP